ncbi:MAG: c-type cytochrome domain-containing protein [Bacteroidales bacterium]|nr:c-type cytochrome domain-containing protein [Bacteroidales bacterium]
MKIFTRLFWISLVIILLTISCKHEPDILAGPDPFDTTTTTVPCSPDTVYFSNVILPLLNSSCAYSGCHDAATAEEGVILNNYSQIMSTGEVKPFKPNESKLYKKIIETDPEDIMPPPPNQPMTQEQIALIYKWIQQGAKKNRCIQLDCDSINATYAASVKPIIENNCKGCHSGGSPGGGIFITSYSETATIANNNSLVSVISHAAGYSPMPKGGKLSNCDIAIIKKWVNDGAPNN